MLRNIVIVLLIIVISLMVFKAFDKNASAQDPDVLTTIIENQKAILEKLDVIERKVDLLRTRIR